MSLSGTRELGEGFRSGTRLLERRRVLGDVVRSGTAAIGNSVCGDSGHVAGGDSVLVPTEQREKSGVAASLSGWWCRRCCAGTGLACPGAAEGARVVRRERTRRGGRPKGGLRLGGRDDLQMDRGKARPRCAERASRPQVERPPEPRVRGVRRSQNAEGRRPALLRRPKHRCSPAVGGVSPVGDRC